MVTQATVDVGDDPPDFDVMDKRFHVDDPWDTFAWLRANAPLFWEETNGVWVASTYELMTRIERTPSLFSSAQGIRHAEIAPLSILSMDDPEHARQRRFVTRGFTRSRIELLRDQVAEITIQVLDALEGRGSFDYVTEVAMPIPMMVIADMLGLGRDEGVRLREWSDVMLDGDDVVDPEDPRMVAATQAFVEWVEFIQPHIEDRRRNPGTDLISVLVAAEGDATDAVAETDLVQDDLVALAHNDLVMFLTLLLVAGNDTTRNTMSGGLLALSQNPDQYDLLRRDASLIPAAVEEILRWVSPVLMHLRTVTQDVEYEGKLLRAGQKVCLLFPSANRDESVFENPHRFDITRTDNDHRAFGHGPHYCLGAHLARLEMEVLLAEQLARFPTLHVPEGADATYGSHTLIRSITSLPAEIG